MNIEVYHTQEFRNKALTFPILATGNEQWLGDGFYFWQEIDFALWWGYVKKCKPSNTSRRFTIYQATLSFKEEDFIDTVFNEKDYNNFVSNIEKFAKRYFDIYGQSPTLEEFNDFIYDYNVWEEIKVIRFQDISESNKMLKVKGFFYKKRIQFRVNEPEIIRNFVLLNNYHCK